MARNITPREKDYPQWYIDVITAAELADYAPVRGCMVIKPLGYAIWEAIHRDLDGRFKELGHTNAYFPLFIPESFLSKEAEHVEGFAPECAVVTHGGGEKLEEPLVIRPTSETIIGHMYAQWIHSWRDLPVLINQWANVVRWEKRTRLFLRTSEFLWQEGHTAHETAEEAREETLRILECYRAFAEDVLAVPVLVGEKTEAERFPGAAHTWCIEGLMQDGKALQMGTSHDLGQNFAKAFEIRFEGRNQQLDHAWTTSWGVSTRLIGALIMAHSDDDGLVLPPRIAPTLAAVVPIFKTDEEKELVLGTIRKLMVGLLGEEEVAASENRIGNDQVQKCFYNRLTEQYVIVDKRETARPGDKFYHWEQRGVPLRIEVGPRDCASGKLVVKNRLDRSKDVIDAAEFTRANLDARLDAFQKALFDRGLERRAERTHEIGDYKAFCKFFKKKRGFVRCFFNPSKEAEATVKSHTRATVRLVLNANSDREGTCVFTGEPSRTEVIFGIAY